MSVSPMKPNEMDVSKLSFSKIKTMGSGAKVVYLNYDGVMNPLYLQSPEMKIPFDSGTYYPDNDVSGKYSIKGSMDNHTSNENMKHFHNKLNEMDEHIITTGVENSDEWFKSQQWFKKKGSVDEKIRDNYKPMVKVSLGEDGEPNGKWPPGFQFKVVKRDGELLCKCFNSDKTEINTKDESFNFEAMCVKNSKVKMLLKCNGLWVSNVGWGCTWRAEQIRFDVPVGFSDYAFDDSEEEGVVLERQSSVLENKPSNFVKDSDDEDDEDDESGEDEVNEQPVKKVVKRKSSS